jgi:hypothetical protein
VDLPTERDAPVISRRLGIAGLVAVALAALPTVASSQDLTTLLTVFLRNLYAGRIVIPVQTAFANLPSATDGTIVYCLDCTEGSDPATGGSTGAFALRVNGRWAALDGGSGSGGNTTAEYIVAEADAGLSAEVAPSAANQVPVSSSSTAAAWGTVPIAAGGTGQTAQTAAFDALAPTTTQGDVSYHNGSDNVRLALGSAYQALRVNSGATAPEWAEAPFYTLHNAGTATGLSPADGTAYYWGQFTLFNPSTSSASQRMTMAKAVRIIAVRWTTIISAGTSPENVSLYIRKNDTTDTLLGTQVWTIGLAATTFSSPTDFTAIDLAAGDDFVLKFQGTWTAAANPTGIIVSAMVWYLPR